MTYEIVNNGNARDIFVGSEKYFFSRHGRLATSNFKLLEKVSKLPFFVVKRIGLGGKKIMKINKEN